MIASSEAPARIQLTEPGILSPEISAHVESPSKTMRGRLLGRFGLKKSAGAEAIDRSVYVEGVMQSLYERGQHPDAEERELLGSIEVYEEDFTALGYKPLQANRSDEEDAFHKENDPDLDVLKRDGKDWYRVVEDEAGKTWFLKAQNKHPSYNKGLVLLNEVRSQQKEYFAHAYGAAIGYPVPEASRVLHDGKPWLASPYVPDHVSVFARDQSVVDRYALQYDSAFKTRPIFNALIGSTGDCATQAVIDPVNRQYLAQDIVLDAKNSTDINNYISYFYNQFKLPQEQSPAFDTLGSLTDEDKEYARTFLHRALAMTETDAARIFSHGVNEFSDPSSVLQTLRTRAEALLVLIDRL